MPLPPSLAHMLSPAAHEIYSYGNLPGLARADLPSVRLERAGRGSLAGDARPCGDLALAGGGGVRVWGFSGQSTHFADRLRPAVPGLGVRRGGVRAQRRLGLVQIVGQAEGMYGFLQPGNAPIWAPVGGRPARDPRDGGLAPARAQSSHRLPYLPTPAFERIALVPDDRRSCSEP